MRNIYAVYLRPWVLAYRDFRPAPMAGRRFGSRAAVTMLAVGAAGVAATGVGYAYWSAHGTASGSAGSGAATLSVASTSTPGGLYPGGPGQAMTVTLTNTGKGIIKVTSLAPTAVTPAGCTSSYITFTPSGTLPSSLGSTPATVPFTVAMDVKAEAACAGQTFTVNFSATGTVG